MSVIAPVEARTRNAVFISAYKQTEVGAIPNDWDVLSIGDLEPFVTSGSRGWAKYYSDLGAPFLRITNMSRNTIYLDLSDLKLVALPVRQSEAERTQLRNGDVLISITADIGIIAYVDSHVPLPAYINQHIALVRFNPARTDNKFVSYFLASENPQKLFRSLTDQGAKAGMNLLTVRKVALAHPRVEEQRAIAGALSAVDALVDALEKLLAKKRAIKLATMRQLLPGKTRLRSIASSTVSLVSTEVGWMPEDWTVRVLDDEIAGLDAGVSVNSEDDTVDIDSGDLYVLKTSAVADGAFRPTECKRVVSRDVKRARLSPRANGILISRMNTPELVGECGYVEKDYPNLFLPDRLWMTRLRASSNLCSKWLSYLLSSAPYKKKLKDIATGTSGSMKNISKGALLSLAIPWPDPQEQQAIANVLSDMDAEIAALERRRDKTRAIKQGMMQQLLSGRTRLV
jgi:type I restriction enzyme, S subunit